MPAIISVLTVSAHGGRLETDLGLEIVPLHLELVAQLEQTLRLLHITLTYITLLTNTVLRREGPLHLKLEVPRLPCLRRESNPGLHGGRRAL